MLDFYLLPDEKNVPNYPEETGGNVIGQINQQTFERLKLKKIIPERFDYHSDFRWDKDLIKEIRKNIQKQAIPDSDVSPLLQMLDAAQTQDSGLIAYAD
nr:hypothetical protein [Pedobacter sp. ASV19]